MKSAMRAVQLFAPGDVRCETIPVPTIQNPHDVLIRVKVCGVCGSDIERVMSKGAYRYPIVIGHEFSGDIIGIDSAVKNLQAEDRVTVMPLVNCGVCDYCRTGSAVTCDDYDYYGSRIDGAMAEYIVVRDHNVLKIPEQVSYLQAAMTDPASVALHAIRKIGLEAGQSVAIFGLGAIGLIAVQWLKALGCKKVIAVDVINDKLNNAASLGADYTIHGLKENVVEKILALTDQKGVDAAIELAGNTITQVQAIHAVRKLGTVVYCGITYKDLLLPNASLNKILRGELIVKGSWNSSISPLPINEWKSALMFMASGDIKLDGLVSHVVKLEECQQIFDMMYNKKEVFTKVIFDPNKV